MRQDLAHEKLISERISKNAQHVRTIRFFLCHQFPSEESEGYSQVHEQYITNVLSLCTNAASISVYYHSSGSVSMQTRPTPEFCGRIFEVITQAYRAPLRSFGIYSVPLLMTGGFAASDDSVQPLIDQVYSSPYMQKNLQSLDLVIQHLPSYNEKPFPSLTSLSLRHSWHSHSSSNWSIYQISQWIERAKLVRLQLINCTNAYAGNIPILVRVCPSLQYLLVSACGDYGDRALPPRVPGWSKEHDALNNNRAPLVSLHIEHMDSWEITALGVIPTLHLNVGSVYGVEFATSFDKDPELFPCLKRVSLPRIKDQFKEDDDQKHDEQVETVKRFCEKRGISIDYKADWLANDTP
jgi:hypothetical protein